jgi:hypothetical protein
MAPCDFWLFTKLKRSLKGSRFDSCEDIMQNMMEPRSFPEMLPAVEGMFVGLSVWSHKGPTLKGIRN